MNKWIIKCLKNSISEKGNYCYSLPVETTKAVIKELNRLNKEYERIYNENCKLRENHNINDITLLDENERLNNIINELEKELREGSFDVYFCSTTAQKTFKSNEIIIKSLVLDKLKALKENK